MTVVSEMTVRLKTGQGDAALQAFAQRGVLDECQQAIAGFVQGVLLRAQDDPDEIRVLVRWSRQQDYRDWLMHPLRQAQLRDLAHFLAQAPVVRLFDECAI